MKSNKLVRINRRVYDALMATKPVYDSEVAHLSRTVERALQQQAEQAIIINPPPRPSLNKLKNEEEITSSSKEEERNKDVENFVESIKKKRADYTPSFENFWKSYQACPAPSLRVNGQSKPKAFDAFKEALKQTTAENLISAAQKAVQGQVEAESKDQWVGQLPDAFRWLRDGKWESLLEDHKPARPKRRCDWTKEEIEADDAERLRIVHEVAFGKEVANA